MRRLIADSAGFLCCAPLLLFVFMLSGCGPTSTDNPVPADETSLGKPEAGARLVIESLSDPTPKSESGCTLPEEAELVEIFNVPRNDKIRVYIKFLNGTFGAKATFKVKSEEPRIAQTVDAISGAAGEVTLTVDKDSDESSRFIVEGVEINQTRLDIGLVTDTRGTPETGDDVNYPQHFTPVVVWDIEENQIVDYNAMGEFNPNAMSDGDNRCYQDGQNSPALKVDMAKRIDCGVKAAAVAADGASLQLLRVKAGGYGKFCFTFPKKNPPSGTPDEYYGRFSDPIAGGASTTSPATSVDSIAYQSPDEPGVRYWGLGTYTPPTDFLETEEAEREVEIEVQFMALLGPGIPTRSHITAVRGKKIKIRRPPVILVHGLWSSSKTWAYAFKNPSPSGARLIEKKFSYDGNLPYTRLLGRAEPEEERLDLRISALIKHAELGTNPDPEVTTPGVKTATTKVDVIAHSMGGLYSRQWIKSASYKKPENFNQGGIHKLATLTTPHWGARLANALINLHQNFFHPPTTHDDELDTLESLLLSAQNADVHQGAICELAENSRALITTATPGARAKVYVASGGDVDGWNIGISTLLFLSLSADQRKTHTDPYIYHEANDGIVSRASQIGNLPIGYDFTDLLHASVGFKGAVTVSSTVAARLYRDLDLPDDWVTPMPEFVLDASLYGVPFAGGRGQPVDSGNYAQQCDEATGPMYLFGQPTGL